MPDTNKDKERHSPLVLVDTENLTREEWLEWRRHGIGGSDVSAIIGVSPFRTARDCIGGRSEILESKMEWSFSFISPRSR